MDFFLNLQFFFFSIVFLLFLNYQTWYLASKKQDTNHSHTVIKTIHRSNKKHLCYDHIIVIKLNLGLILYKSHCYNTDYSDFIFFNK